MKITIEPTEQRGLTSADTMHSKVSVSIASDDLDMGETMEQVVKTLQAWGFHNDTIAKYLDEELAWQLGLSGRPDDVTGAIAQLKSAVGKAKEVEDDTREKLYDEIDEKVGGSWYQKWFFRKIIEFMWEQQLKDEITGSEAAELVRGTLEAEEKGGEGAAVKSVISKIMAGVYKAFDESVNSVVYPIILTAIGFGIGVPLLPLCLFWFARWLWLRKHPGEKLASEEPPVLNAE